MHYKLYNVFEIITNIKLHYSEGQILNAVTRTEKYQGIFHKTLKFTFGLARVT